MKALSELFDQTTLFLPVRRTPIPDGATPLDGHNLAVSPLDEPVGADFRRKVALLLWLPRHMPVIWREIRRADCVHAPVPGDIGTLGLLAALTQRKPLFVRHCGTWGHRATLANRFLAWLLPRIARGRNVVMATGGSDIPPSPENLNVNWIFSTTLTEREFASIPERRPWRLGEPLRLVTVGRLSPAKNTSAVVRALPLIRRQYSQTTLDILGGGPCESDLEKLAVDLGLEDSVTLHGNVSHETVLETLTKAHLFVFPTRVAEGFPKAVLEALACGLPVIAPPISVIPHLLKHDNGTLIDDTEPETVANAVLEVISDSDRLAEMSASARATSRDYTLERWQAVIEGRLRGSWGALKDE